MTTPTKEQIDRIIKATCELYQCGDCDRCEVYSDCFHHNKKVIIEWEKLKNIPKQGKIWLKGPVAEGTERKRRASDYTQVFAGTWQIS